MQWYNSKTNELQSTPPWGASYLHPEVQAEIYPDWQQVPDTFTPPAPPTEIVTPAIDENVADLWQALLTMSAEIETLKGGN